MLRAGTCVAGRCGAGARALQRGTSGSHLWAGAIRACTAVVDGFGLQGQTRRASTGQSGTTGRSEGSGAVADVIVLGGAGEFGSRLVARLGAEPGLRVHVAGRSKARASALIDALMTRGDGAVRTERAFGCGGAGATWRAAPSSAACVDASVLAPPKWKLGAGSSLVAASIDVCGGADRVGEALAGMVPDGSVPALVVNAVGPYVADSDGYGPAVACARGGINYLDLADGREYVEGFAAAVAEGNPGAEGGAPPGVMVRTAGSSVSVLSSALADAAVAAAGPGYQLTDLDYWIGVGHQGPRGIGTIASVLDFCGRPFRAFRDGEMGKVEEIGWGSLTRRAFHGIAVSRLSAPVPIPDLDEFPRRYPALQNLKFGASLELPVVMWAMRGLAALRSTLGIASLTQWAPALAKAASLLNVFGSPDGGMGMEGRVVHEATGQARTFRADVAGHYGYGPDTPIVAAQIAAVAAARAARSGQTMPAHMAGVGSAAGIASVEDYRAELDDKGYPFSWKLAFDDDPKVPTPSEDGALGAFSYAMGADEVGAMPAGMLKFHNEGGAVTGALTVTRSKSWLNNLVTTLGGLPRDSGGVAVRVDVTSEDGVWKRTFFSGPPSAPGAPMSKLESRWSLLPGASFRGASGIVLESFYGGLMQMAFHVAPLGRGGAHGFRHSTKGMFVLWRALRIPFPLSLRGDGYSLAHADGKGWYVKVDIDAPILGRLVSYEGDVYLQSPPPSSPSSSSSSTS